MSASHAHLASFYDERAAALYVFLLSFTGQETDARDLLQEVFRKLAVRPMLFDDARNQRAVLLYTCDRMVVAARERFAK